eukprot:5375502-Amphidinium_carterae.1
MPDRGITTNKYNTPEQQICISWGVGSIAVPMVPEVAPSRGTCATQTCSRTTPDLQSEVAL